jgi:hypothetical protein
MPIRTGKDGRRAAVAFTFFSGVAPSGSRSRAWHCRPAPGSRITRLLRFAGRGWPWSRNERRSCGSARFASVTGQLRARNDLRLSENRKKRTQMLHCWKAVLALGHDFPAGVRLDEDALTETLLHARSVDSHFRAPAASRAS